MSRKKTASKKATATQPNENTAAAVMETQIHESDPVSPPAWIDGAPVDINGQSMSEGFKAATPQTELTGQGQPSEVRPPEPTMQPATDSVAESTTEPHGKNWGDPYKSLFSCPEMGFELGENRRFKQRVFRFTEKPTAEILSSLKEHGFIYRAAEKAWTINATPQSRKLTDDLAREWAGPNYAQGVER